MTARATRRGLLAMAPAAALVAPAIAAAAHPDAELLHLGARFDALAAEEAALWRVADAHCYGETVDEAVSEAAGDQAEEFSARASEVIGEIERHEASTLAGVLVKVRCLLWCHVGAHDDEPGSGIEGLLNPLS